jgi:hypothetical protein
MTRAIAESRVAMSRRFVAIAAGLAIGFAATAAPADVTTSQCVDANSKGQQLRREGKLRATHAQFLSCTDPACPRLVRDDCARRLDEVDSAQPTIAFEVKDASGADVYAVKVTMDGEPWAESLEGEAVAVDPGKHSFVFDIKGVSSTVRTVVVTEGEKGRRELVVLKDSLTPPAGPSTPGAPASSSGAPPSVGTSADRPARALGVQRIAGLATAAAGVVGLGLGAAFGILTTSEWASAKSACGDKIAQCPVANVASAQSHRSTALGDATVSTVGFAAGGVLLAAGAVLFFTGRPAPTPSAAHLEALPILGPGQAGLAVLGTFF